MDNKALLDQLMGEDRNGDVKLDIPFSSDQVCHFNAIWNCPYELFTHTKAYLAHVPCNKRHGQAIKTAFETAYSEYKTERLRLEPNWDGVSDGDPWGYAYNLLKLARQEVDRVEKTMYDHGERADIFLKVTVNDDAYNKLTNEINKFAAEADLLTDREQEMLLMLEVVQKLEAKRFLHFQELVQHQIASNSAYKAAVDGGESSMPPPPTIIDLRTIELHNATQQEAARALSLWKLMPCSVCGCLLSAPDGGRRMSDHVTGKLHIGFHLLRTKLNELEKVGPLSSHSHPWAWFADEFDRNGGKVKSSKAVIVGGRVPPPPQITSTTPTTTTTAPLNTNEAKEDDYSDIAEIMDPKRFGVYERERARQERERDMEVREREREREREHRHRDNRDNRERGGRDRDRDRNRNRDRRY